ncbi:hypothetical protein OKA05_02955 [Luteolibacter arcticus]|uniref:Replication-associated protein ORF2/G2P domain-containing protein n=1 Tax=Luteolibacter arcticus TaxID=1581411 RepID=A0ABT3GCY6_9BACT|nr:hypothetical protein [Luteolibacter arcticus]MCW1921495.1 hypothetical protein [Luteolibacter arcticus]
MRDYSPPNWLTVAGVSKKRKAIERKGLPSFKNWRFITLTLDPELFEQCPLSGYLQGKDHMRRFLFACRGAGLWSDDAKWCWKMEFQANGWVHWHLLVERKSKFTHDELRDIARFWGLGRTNVERVNVRDFLYSFKYAFKAVYQVDQDGTDSRNVAPEWFLDYHSSRLVTVTDEDGTRRKVSKPVTFARVRFWQTSKGFYTGLQIEDERPAIEPKSALVPFPARVAAERLERSVQVVSRDAGGNYKSSAVITLAMSKGRFWHLASWHTAHGAAVGLAVGSFAVPAFIVQQNTTSCLIAPLIRENRLSLPAAERLRQEGTHLRTS